MDNRWNTEPNGKKTNTEGLASRTKQQSPPHYPKG